MELIINKRKVFIATGGKEFDANKPALIMLHGAGMDHTCLLYTSDAADE